MSRDENAILSKANNAAKRGFVSHQHDHDLNPQLRMVRGNQMKYSQALTDLQGTLGFKGAVKFLKENGNAVAGLTQRQAGLIK